MKHPVSVEARHVRNEVLTLHPSTIWQYRAAWMQRILVALAFLFLVNEIQTEAPFRSSSSSSSSSSLLSRRSSFFGFTGRGEGGDENEGGKGMRSGASRSRSRSRVSSSSARDAVFPRIHMILRAYSGDRARLMNMFMPSFEAFFVLSQASFTLVLDAESPQDEALGADFLEHIEALYTSRASSSSSSSSFASSPSTVPYSDTRGHRTLHANISASHPGSSIRVVYVQPPDEEILAASPFKNEVGTRYASKGYTRQLYDTFWFDTFVPLEADMETDVVAIIDADAPFVAVTAMENTLVIPILMGGDDGNHEDGEHKGVGGKRSQTNQPHTSLGGTKGNLRLLNPVTSPDLYFGDGLFLKEPTNYTIMATNALPQLFRMSTFAGVRHLISQRWDTLLNGNNAEQQQQPPVDSFNQAWIKCFGGSVTPLDVATKRLQMSPANVLFHYGIKYEPRFYSAITQDSPIAIPVFAINRGGGNGGSPVTGCCRAFEFAWCPQSTFIDYVHITQRTYSTWTKDARVEAAYDVYDEINRVLFDGWVLSKGEYEGMREKCNRVKEWAK